MMTLQPHQSWAPIQKMGFLNVFCAIICEMCNTKVRVVDESLLNKWRRTLPLVQLAGFEIEFAVDRLNKITRVYFAMKAKSFLSKVKSKVEELSVGVKELEAKLEAEKMNLEKLALEVEQHETVIEYRRSALLEECFNDLSQLRWKKAWDGSHLMYR
ncbi:hypothetical protein HS088_TW02G01016 [Tripterygium wilfordii]|uniref:Uncharacterized protein n=1 Tax=Tripterygium wilfordii TaxID=458696 RepID=A0A7J7E084_TRIWF|nr:hypothetical protein HS088_TW02G01016 [Tripterygium wilfordii]